MAVVLKSKNGGMKKSPVSAWLGYGAVAVFGLAIISTAFMGGGNAPDPMDSAYSYSDFKDLADMPFSNEEAEAQLLSSVRYGDIAKNDLINALFTEEDKAERQAEDAANGVPEPPDEEYAEAAKAKENVRIAKERYQRSRQAAKNAVAQRTSKGSLNASSGVRATGGSSGVSATIWRADDKNNKSSGSSANVNSRGGGTLSNQLAQELKKGGRGGGFMSAYEKSRAAANAQDLEAAHALAADAFQNSGDLEGDLKGDLEDMAAEMDLDKALGAIDKEKGLTNTLDEKLSEAKDNAEKKSKKDYKCDGAMRNGKIDGGCMANEFMNALMDIGKQALTSLLNRGKGELTPEEAANKNSQIEANNQEIENLESKNELSASEKARLQQLKQDNAYLKTSGVSDFSKDYMKSRTERYNDALRRYQMEEMSKKMQEENRRLQQERFDNWVKEDLLRNSKNL
ncbi:hypothetical protein [Candidatus Proelusimicrobium volucris]|uniref:hypothetical protein n=1 Tax=Candidatus Proelusimicrobium volucris TaxID=3416225 RepID=UPI003D13CDFE